MEVNFSGLVDLHVLPATEPLLPLYEAIVNSIQSIQQAVKIGQINSIEDGVIQIEIKRHSTQLAFEGWETDIEDIIITDNGIGFTDENFISFNTYASDFKKLLGCKGVGRMIWLKAFNNVFISSNYNDNGTIKHREFYFDENNAVNNEKISLDCNDLKTSVYLKDLKVKNRSITPKMLKTIARDILNHCFLYFVTDQAPKISIKDEKDSISINHMYAEIGKENIETDSFIIKNYNFNIVHYRNYNPNSSSHKINLCANDRCVKSINAQNYLNGVNSKFIDSKGNYVYNGFVTSSYLDNNVNRERTSFDIYDEQVLTDEISKKAIIEKVVESILKYLNADLNNYNESKRQKIELFVNSKHPKYRMLLEHFPEGISEILLSDDEEKLELELFKQEQKFRLKLKEEGSELKKAIKENIHNYNIEEKKKKYQKKISDLGKSSLADYIVQRKAILDLLEEEIKYKDNNEKYYPEASIHQLIFPMQTTSDDIDYTSHNLWLIDEKLSYHYYLASDKKIKSMKPVESESLNEPDIMIFDAPFAFTDEMDQPFRNITIIEFKRPGRNEYNKNDNPIQQVIEYMDDIINGNVKAKDGMIISGNEHIRFYCYIICDISEKIKMYTKQNDFKPTPDSLGYYHYLNNYNAYIEIIPYNKMIQDSKKRNKILFDKLFNQ